MLARPDVAEPSEPPFAAAVTCPKSLVTFHETGVATPFCTLSRVVVAGSTVTPRSVASSCHGFSCSGEVRRDSTRISHTPGVGLAIDLLVGLHPLPPR